LFILTFCVVLRQRFLQGRQSSGIDVVGEMDQGGLRGHTEGSGDELGGLVLTKSRRQMPRIVRDGFPRPPSDPHALVSFPDSSTRAPATAR
jgi:hypothetical protein